MLSKSKSWRRAACVKGINKASLQPGIAFAC